MTNRRTFLALFAASAVLPSCLDEPKLAPHPPLTWDTVVDAFADVEFRDEAVERIWVSPSTAQRFPAVFGLDNYDQETHRRILAMGIVGYLWGSEVRVSRKVPDEQVVCVGTVEADSREDLRKYDPQPGDWTW